MAGKASPLAMLAAFVAGLAAILATLAPIGLSAEATLGPNFLLIVMCFWCARRPTAAPPLLVFTLGLLHDLARDGPVGAELLALLAVTQALRGWSSMRPQQGLLSETARFALAAAAFDALVWFLLVATYAPAPPIFVMLQRVGITVVAYPFAAALLQRAFGVRIGEERFRHLSF